MGDLITKNRGGGTCHGRVVGTTKAVGARGRGGWASLSRVSGPERAKSGSLSKGVDFRRVAVSLRAIASGGLLQVDQIEGEAMKYVAGVVAWQDRIVHSSLAKALIGGLVNSLLMTNDSRPDRLGGLSPRQGHSVCLDLSVAVRVWSLIFIIQLDDSSRAFPIGRRLERIRQLPDCSCSTSSRLRILMKGSLLALFIARTLVFMGDSRIGRHIVFGEVALRVTNGLVTPVRDCACRLVELSWIWALLHDIGDIRKAAACALDEIKVRLIWHLTDWAGSNSLPVGVCSGICADSWPAFVILYSSRFWALLGLELVTSSLASSNGNSDLIIDLLGRPNRGRIVECSFVGHGLSSGLSASSHDDFPFIIGGGSLTKRVFGFSRA